MTQPKRLSDHLSATSQIDPANMQALADAGFRSVINNRLDGEDPAQPDWIAIERAARDAGIEARHIPVIPGAIGDEDVSQFAAALEDLPGPIVAFCRTGTRSTTLWALANAGKRSPDELIATAADAGYDIAPLRGGLTKG